MTASATQPLTYQWQKNGTNLNNGGNISGTTTTNLTLIKVAQNDAANYSVVVTNTAGSITSSNATLSVIPPPMIVVAKSNNSITLSWPAASQGFVAQQAASLISPVSWGPVTNSPTLVGDRYTLTIAPGNGTVFYRLIFQ